MTVTQGESKRTHAVTKAKPAILRRFRPRQARSLEVAGDIWFEILSRLPTKTLVTSKCVCQTWHDIAAHILVHHRKMPFLPVLGVSFEVTRYFRDGYVDNKIDKFDSYRIYISLTTKEISARIDSPGDHTVNYGYSEQMLENLSLDFSALYAKPSLIASDEVSYTGHNGLLLIVHNDGTYKVINPATKQVLDLPKPSGSNKPFAGGMLIHDNAIINLSRPFSSTASSFVVIGFLKQQKLVSIYYSNTRKWVQYGFALEDELVNASWFFSNYVFLLKNRTLFVLTNRGRCVAFQFGSLHEPKISSSYSFGLPEEAQQYCITTLGESQGCLYLSHANKWAEGSWIWKHDREGISSTTNSWILLFRISSSTSVLCKPVAKEHLVKYFRGGHALIPMGFHPQLPVTFIYVVPSLLFAYDLTNGSLEQIAMLNGRERLRPASAIFYSPCLASLGPFMSLYPGPSLK